MRDCLIHPNTAEIRQNCNEAPEPNDVVQKRAYPLSTGESIVIVLNRRITGLPKRLSIEEGLAKCDGGLKCDDYTFGDAIVVLEIIIVEQMMRRLLNAILKATARLMQCMQIL
mmetsp:Transcript_32558/g.59186  ORF Transcript_32558/g.59186 Transcript_32558/m.59186 type:complete len:113 (-) Transcript_32558:109-447(-)